MSITISFQICLYVNYYLLPDMFLCQFLSPSRYVYTSISISFQICLYVNFYLLPDMFICQFLSLFKIHVQNYRNFFNKVL